MFLTRVSYVPMSTSIVFLKLCLSDQYASTSPAMNDCITSSDTFDELFAEEEEEEDDEEEDAEGTEGTDALPVLLWWWLLRPPRLLMRAPIRIFFPAFILPPLPPIPPGVPPAEPPTEATETEEEEEEEELGEDEEEEDDDVRGVRPHSAGERRARDWRARTPSWTSAVVQSIA